MYSLLNVILGPINSKYTIHYTKLRQCLRRVLLVTSNHFGTALYLAAFVMLIFLSQRYLFWIVHRTTT